MGAHILKAILSSLAEDAGLVVQPRAGDNQLLVASHARDFKGAIVSLTTSQCTTLITSSP